MPYTVGKYYTIHAPILGNKIFFYKTPETGIGANPVGNPHNHVSPDCNGYTPHASGNRLRLARRKALRNISILASLVNSGRRWSVTSVKK